MMQARSHRLPLGARALFSAACVTAVARAYSYGPDSCVSAPGHGANTGSGVTIALLDVATSAVVTAYVPGTQYRLQLSKAAGTFEGAELGVCLTANAAACYGSFGVGTIAPSTNARAMTACAGVTHGTQTQKTTFAALWTAPAAGTGSVTAWAAVAHTYDIVQLNIALTVPELAPSPSAGATPPSSSRSATPSPSPAAALARPAAYAFTAPLSPALTLSWSVAGGRLWMRLANSASGWAGIAVNGDAKMVGGDAIAVSPGLTPPVGAWTLGGQTMSAVLPVSVAGPLDAASGNFTLDAGGGGGWVAEFSRPMAAGAYAGARAVPDAGTTTLIAAWGASSAISSHTSGSSFAGTFDAVRGTLVSTSRASVLIAHALFMLAAWGALAPVAVGFSRFGRALEPSTGPAALWFVLHSRLNAAAWTGSLVGFGLAVAYVANGSPGLGPHFNSAHSKLGLTIFLLGFFQPINACVRPAKPASPAEGRSRARALWEALHKGAGYAAIVLAVAAVPTGLAQAGYAQGLTTAYAVVAAAAGAAALALEVRAARERARAAGLAGLVQVDKPRL